MSQFTTRVIRSTFLSNSIWAIIGSFISKGINFASIAWIARILGPEIFGEYNVIQTTVGMFGTVSGLGLGLAATKLIAEWREKDIQKVGKIIGTLYLISFLVSLTVAIIFFLSAGWISNSLLNNGNLSLLLQITSVLVIFDSINGVQNGVLSGFELFKEITIINSFIGIISSPLLIVVTYLYGLTGLTIVLLLTRLLNIGANRFYLQKKFKTLSISVTPKLNKDVLKSIFGISIPSFLSSFATSPINWVATTLFINQPSGYKALGTYNAANQLKTLVLFLPESAGKVTIPQLANSFGSGDLKKFKSTVLLTFVFNVVLAVLTAIALYFFGGIFQQIIGVKFELSNALIIIVLATGILIAATNAIGYIFICSNLIWYDFLLRILWGITLIILILFYGRYNGAIGFGISMLGAYIVNMFGQVLVLFAKFRFKQQ